MKVTKLSTPEMILQELGSRLVQQRIASRLTQADLAEQAGVSKRTVERFEAGGEVQLGTLIRILRVLGQVEMLDRLLPVNQVSPMDQLREQDRPKRKRASSKRVVSRKSQTPPKPWKWGDEQ